jgi:hypothetical protein
MKLSSLIRNKKTFAFVIISILVMGSIPIYLNFSHDEQNNRIIDILDILNLTSLRITTRYDHIMLENQDRSMAMIGTYLSCWYDITDGSSHLLPLLIDGSEPVERFRTYTNLDLPYNIPNSDNPQGGCIDLCTNIARACFEMSSGIMVLGIDDQSYALGLMAVPIASYLNIPVILMNEFDDPAGIKKLMHELDSSYLIPVGEFAKEKVKSLNTDILPITGHDEAFNITSIVVEDRFGRLDYIAVTNPLDTHPISVEEDIINEQYQDVDSLLIDTNTIDVDLIGESIMVHSISVMDGIIDLRINVNFTDIVAKPLDPLKGDLNVEPMSFITLKDPQGRLTASSPSFSIGGGNNFVETLVVDNPGEYELEVKVYCGVKGASTMMRTSFGISRFQGGYRIETHNRILSDTNLPYYTDLSILSPYLSASRGGLVLSEPDFSLYKGDFRTIASGYSTGPWYERELMEFATEKAYSNAQDLKNHIENLPENLKEPYLNEHGWLALLGGGTMIPMAYPEKDPSWVENEVWGTGWATDLPYSLDLSLSVGRPLGRTASDCSALIARTLFYEDYTEGHIDNMESQYGSSGSWKDHFHFLAGEGGGRTGWMFHQREFSRIAEEHGFSSEVYMQDYENGREYMVSRGAFERANYFEMILHGDWSWFSPELNGWDRYSTGVRVSDIMKEPYDWELGPSVFNSGVCLLGRIGGLRPEQSITQAFFHAGINAFFSATRSTGQEAKAGPIEEALLFEDLSTGEAIRKDKRDNEQAPTFYVRTLYGDPAFDPYEPENGYGCQGRPILIKNLSSN